MSNALHQLAVRFVALNLLLFTSLSSLAATSSVPIVTTIPPLQFIATAIAEENVSVLMGAQDNPHQFSLSPTDRINLSQAELIIWLDSDFEVELGEFLSREDTNARSLQVSAIPDLLLLELESGELDPHLWLDPDNVLLIAERFTEILVELRPENTRHYRDNLAGFRRRIAVADAEIAERFRAPGGSRFIVYHNAFQYFESHYGVAHELALVANPEVAPGMRDIMRIRRRLAELQPACLILEPGANNDLIDTMLEDTTALRRQLDPLGLAIPLSVESYIALLREVGEGLSGCIYQ